MGQVLHGCARTDSMRERFVGLAEDANARYLSLAAELETLEAKAFDQAQRQQMLAGFQVISERALARLQTASAEDKRLALHIYDVQARVFAKEDSPRYTFTWLGGIDPEGDVCVTDQV